MPAKINTNPLAGHNPTNHSVVPQKYIDEVLKHGSGFEGGKHRICQMYKDNTLTASARAAKSNRNMELEVLAGLRMASRVSMVMIHINRIKASEYNGLMNKAKMKDMYRGGMLKKYCMADFNK